MLNEIPLKATIVSSKEESKTSIDELQKSISSKIGGVAGLFKSEMSANISLEKKNFQPGEPVKICVELDNTRCTCHVKYLKAQLIRIVKYFYINGGSAER